MDVSSFFSKLARPGAGGLGGRLSSPFKGKGKGKDVGFRADVGEFERCWAEIETILTEPDEKQIMRGISSTPVPSHLELMIDSLVWEMNDQGFESHSTGPCLEYFLNNDVYSKLVFLGREDIPYGIKAQILSLSKTLLATLPSHYLVHHALHRPLLRLLHSSIDSEDHSGDGMGSFSSRSGERANKGSRHVGGQVGRRDVIGGGFLAEEEVEAGLVDVLRAVCARMGEYPPLLLIFMHDRSEPLTHSSRKPETLADNDTDEIDELDELDLAYRGTNAEGLKNGEIEPRVVTDDLSIRQADEPADANRKPANGLEPMGEPDRADVSTYLDFVFFEYLMKFVHRDGSIGDSAREGLLALFDIAFLPTSPSVPTWASEVTLGPPQEDGEISPLSREPITLARLQLAEHILGKHFIDVIIAGLGAVYSVLPSKLRLGGGAGVDTGADHAKGEAAPRLGDRGKLTGAGALEHPATNEKGEELKFLSDEQVVSQLETFVVVFDFIEKVLDKCTAAGSDSARAIAKDEVFPLVARDIVVSIEQNFRTSFLQNVLYAEILESSTGDGSGVAVASYMNVLLSEAGAPAGRGRLSRILLETLSNPSNCTGDMASMTYSLRDFVIDMISSDTESAATAGHALMITLFTRHCSCASSGLLREVADIRSTAFSADLNDLLASAVASHAETTDALIALDVDTGSADLRGITFDAMHSTISAPPIATDPNTKLYQALMRRLVKHMEVTTEDAVATSYRQEAYRAISRSSCFGNAMRQMKVEMHGNSQALGLSGDHWTHAHSLDPQDHLLQTMLAGLRRFFEHAPGQNLALTGAMSALLLCPYRSLGGWSSKSTEKGHTQAGAMTSGKVPLVEEENPFIDQGESQLPAVYLIIRGLVRQAEAYHTQVKGLDKLLIARRSGVKMLPNAIAEARDLTSSEEGRLKSQAAATSPPATPTRGFLQRSQTSTGRIASGIATYLTPTWGSESPQKDQLAKDAELEHGGAQASYGANLQPLVADEITSGPWTPPSKARISCARRTLASGSTGRDGLRHTASTEAIFQISEVNLVDVMDNIVLLEAFLRETIAILGVRRTLGIDR